MISFDPINTPDELLDKQDVRLFLVPNDVYFSNIMSKEERNKKRSDAKKEHEGIGSFEPINKNLIENFSGQEYSNIALLGGRRKLCKAKGLKGKEFRECLKETKVEDKGKSRSDKKELAKTRNDEFRKALLEGKVEKGKSGRKLQKFNPAAVGLRGLFLTALRFNIFGISSRLYPALLSESEAKEKNFDVSNLPNARKALDKVKAFYIRVGGDPNRLDKPIKGAHNKPVLNTKKAKARKEKEKVTSIDGEYNFDGEYYGIGDEEYSNMDAVITASIITASTGVALKITDIIVKSGAKKNPYDPNSPKGKSFDTDGTDAPQPTPEETKAIQDAEKGAAEDKAKGLPLDDKTKPELDGDNKILGLPPAVVYIGGALLLVGGFLIIKKLMKVKSA